MPKHVTAGSLILNVKDYGAKGDYNTNDTAAITAALTAASANGAAVFFPQGTYTADNLVLPDFVRMIGAGGGPSRFTANSYYLEGTRRSGTALRRLTGSTNPLLTQSGAGSSLENFELQGNAGTAPVLVHTGFQTTMRSITVIGGAGIGIDVQKANNSRWYDIEVQNCGSATMPGMKVWSKAGTGLANETNTLDIYGLTIERCANVHLDIGWDPALTTTNAEYWVEFVRITNLHIESSSQNAGSGAGIGNVDPAIRLGGVRSIHFTNPFIYAGPGPLIQHAEQLRRAVLNGGIKLVNGTLLGSDTATGVADTPVLVQLDKGEDFSMDAMRWSRVTPGTGRCLAIAAAYSPSVRIGVTNEPAVSYTDLRAAKSPMQAVGDLAVDGHLLTTQASPPTLNNGAGTTGTAVLSGATDTSGKVFFGTTASPPAAGAIVTQINFNKSFGSEKPVTVSPGNALTAGLGLFAAVSADGANLKVYATNAPAASQANATYQYSYRVG